MKIVLSTIATIHDGLGQVRRLLSDVVVDGSEDEFWPAGIQLIAEQAIDDTLEDDELLVHTGIYKWQVEA